MSARLLCLSAVSALVISACATSNQENPNYKYSTQYKAATPYQTTTTSQGATVAASTQPVTYTTTTSQPVTYTPQSTTYASQPVTYGSSQHVTYASNVQTQAPAPVVYQGTQMPMATTQAGYTRVDTQCLQNEQRRELIGGAIGGAVGAIAGKKFVGGTTGTVLGAAVGGTAGYGLGDKSINCDPIQMPVTQASTAPQPYAQQTYQAQPQPQYQQPQPQYQQPQPQYVAPNSAAAPVVAAPQTYTAPTDQAYGDTFGTPGYHAVMAAQGQAPAAPAPVYGTPQTAYQQPQPTYVPQQPVYAPQQPMYQAQQAATPAMPSNMHQVVEGDTVYSMSKRLCVTPQDIQRMNGLNADFGIQLGQFIQLPAPRC